MTIGQSANAAFTPRCIRLKWAALSMSLALALPLLDVAIGAQSGPKDGEWRTYGGDLGMTKYSPLAQINKDNIRDLQVAWRWRSPDIPIQQSNPAWRASRNEDTPLMVKGVLYTLTPLGLVAALDATSGQTRWVYNPESYRAGRPNIIGFTNRGLAYWTDGTAARLFVGSSDMFLISIDAETGKPDPRFGEGGKADMTVGIRGAVRGRNMAGRRPLVAGDVVIVGNAVAERSFVPGDVHAFDARTGKRLWTFHTIPKNGEFGYESWLDASADTNGGANIWGGMAYDRELGYVYLAGSTPNSDYYGAGRPGNNLFAETLICLDAKTGKRVWHFQAVHHGLWDYDFPADPVLGDITVNRRRIKTVMQVSKQAFTYVFDRKTGQPVWPIVERPVPPSDVEGEWTSPTQPVPTKPPAFDLQGSTEDNVIDLTPGLKQRALSQLERFVHGPLFTPPSAKGTLMVPGIFGGANWGGAGFDPETGFLYVPSLMRPWLLRVDPARGKDGNPLITAGPCPAVDCAIDGLSIMKPPYSRVTALDMNAGNHAWMSPLGNGPIHHPLLSGLNVGPLGDHLQGGSILVTKALLFVTVTRLQCCNAQPLVADWAQWGDTDMDTKVIYVFDKQLGQLLRVIDIDNMSAAAPMTYSYGGRQFIVVATGGAEDSELVAFSVPGEGRKARPARPTNTPPVSR